MRMWQSLSKQHTVGMLGLVTFIFVSIFCLTLSGIATIVCHDHGMAMADTSVQAHLDHWQSVTVGESVKLIAFAAAVSVLMLCVLANAVKNSASPASRRSLAYARRHPPDYHQSYLIFLFSSGILHAKVFPA